MTLEQLAKPGGKSKVRLLSHNTKKKIRWTKIWNVKINKHIHPYKQGTILNFEQFHNLSLKDIPRMTPRSEAKKGKEPYLTIGTEEDTVKKAQ